MQSPESRRIAAALASRLGQSTDPTFVAASVVSLWRDMERVLSPIIGVRGVAALYGRTIFVTSRMHSWLGNAPEGVQSSMDLDSLHTAISAQPRAVGIEGGSALFSTFRELLVSMVGAVLTEQLLRDVLTSSSSGHAAQDGR